MNHRYTSALALTTLTLALASCGGRAPTPTGPAALVQVNVTALGNLGKQGLTADAPERHYDVIVRDAAGQLITFNGTTYDPTGQGATQLTLNIANEFRQTILLPKGSYTFENKVKADADNTLLAYGPADENPGTVDINGSLIRIKSHAVYNEGNSSLDPSLFLDDLYTNSTLNLRLNLKTASFAPAMGPTQLIAMGATVPTSDIGPVTYTLGNATDGVLNGAGSKIGVNVTARGTATDHELNVTATFMAWVQDEGSDTASWQQVSESFAHNIQTNVLTTDTVMPTLTVNDITAFVGTPVTLSGMVGDDVQVQALRVYVDGNLVSSSSADEQNEDVSAVTGDEAGNWNGSWTPMAEGDYEVVVIAEDSSGNETRSEQTVTATPAPDIIPVFYNGSVYPVHVLPNQPRSFRISYDGNGELHMWTQVLSCTADCGSYTLTVTDPNGNFLPITDNGGYKEVGYYYAPGIYTMTIQSDFEGDIDLEAHLH